MALYRWSVNAYISVLKYMRLLRGGHMKRLFLLFICIILCACSQSKESFFDYQASEISFECTIIYDGHENEARITMSAPDEEGQRENIRVEYISPAIIGGYVLKKSNGEYKGKMGSVEIPFGDTVSGVVKKAEQAFALSEDMISDIKAADNGMTQATVASEELSGTVMTDADGILRSVELSFSDGHSLSIIIN